MLRTDFRARLRAESANRYGLVSVKTVGGGDILATYERASGERVGALVDEHMELGLHTVLRDWKGKRTWHFWM